jgi:Cu+-exporting ATPase
MPLERALFKIIGMYCASCKSIVEKQLKEENAIKRIAIDYMTDTVLVEFETSLITKEEIKRRLEINNNNSTSNPNWTNLLQKLGNNFKRIHSIHAG